MNWTTFRKQLEKIKDEKWKIINDFAPAKSAEVSAMEV